MLRLVPLARSRGLAIIEDAAPALGATIRTAAGWRPVGGFGDIACFSFQGAKIMTTGEGGMAVTASKALFERMRFYNEHGRATGGKAFEIAEVGFKYKMSNIQAALGLGQLERIDELVGKKRTILEWYRERLGNIPGLAFNAQNSWSRGIAWMSSVILDSERHPAREEVCRRIRADERLKGLRVIAYTAHAFEDERSRILAEGFDALLTKPISRDGLLSAVAGTNVSPA